MRALYQLPDVGERLSTVFAGEVSAFFLFRS
jgi:hypothetical protein